VVTAPTPASPPPASPTPPTTEGTDLGDIARITLRLPEGLKEAAERAAAAEAISVNAWLVRAIARVVAEPPRPPGPPSPPSPPGFDPPTRGRMGRRVTGYAQA
jgi:hypothetical protein